MFSPCTHITTSAAIDYTRAHFGNRRLFPDFAVHGALHSQEDTDLREVLFTLDGHSYRMTCWLVASLADDNSFVVYGEW